MDRRSSILATLGASFFLVPASAAGGAVLCDGGMVSVSAYEPSTSRKVCDLAGKSIEVLASCVIVTRYPVSVIVDNPGSHPPVPSTSLAHYNAATREIHLPNPVQLPTLLSRKSPYRLLPPDELFASLVVHEMVHAQLSPSPRGGQMLWAEHEYIAFAIQFHALAETNQETLQRAFPVSAQIDIRRFSSLCLVMAPEMFAAMAWRHFSQDGNGCDFVGRIIAGDVGFPQGPP